MQLVQNENLIDTLKKLNPWFRSNEVPAKFLKPYKRSELPNLIETMKKAELATLLIGGRRVGKSVLMYQIIDHLLKSGVDGKRILFIQGDNPLLREQDNTANILNTLIKIYEKYIVDVDLSTFEDTIYIFLDEAQSIPNWDAEIKTLIDLKYPIKFFITGSSSSKLRKGAQSPLVGRVYAAILPPFTYKDFFNYELYKKSEDISNDLIKVRGDFLAALKIGDINSAKKSIDSVTNIISKYKAKELFEEYILYGGFPYVVDNRHTEDVDKYLKDILLMTFSRDILQEEQIREPMAFERLMTNICANISGIFKYKSLAEKVGLKDERTVRRYIDYYLDSHYVSVSNQFSFTNKQTSVSSANKKLYVIDTGLINTLLFKNNQDIKDDTAYRGTLIENIVHNAILDFKQSVTGNLYDSVPHWENTKTHKEIDFIFQPDGKTYPVEVKSKDTINEEELLEIKGFLANKKVSEFGIVITNQTNEIRGNILLIPSYIFAILV